MDRGRARTLLGITVDAPNVDVQRAYEQKERALKQRIVAAGDDTARYKYSGRLVRLRKVRDLALAPESSGEANASATSPAESEPQEATVTPQVATPVTDAQRVAGRERLGLPADAPAPDVLASYKRLWRPLRGKTLKAPTDALRREYRAELEELQRARHHALGEEPPAVRDAKSAMAMDFPSAQVSGTGLPGSPVGSGGPVPPGGQEGPVRAVAIRSGDVLAGRYEIRHRIGAGGIGAVYSAYDRNKKQAIAIKVLLPELASSPRVWQRFLTEAQVSTQLSHPNIVDVFDVQSHGPMHFLTMELLYGQTLRALIQTQTQLEVREVRELGTALCSALAYAHDYTIHGEVKPENVFLCEDGTVKLMDFGIAQLRQNTPKTMTGADIGTAYYMAPEQLLASKDLMASTALDHRVDQYAVAVILYELLTGQVPTRRARPASEMGRAVPRTLSDALEKALATDPDKRFATISDFDRGLSRRLGFPRGRAMAGAAAAVLILATVFLTWSSWGPGWLRDQALVTRIEDAQDAARIAMNDWRRLAESETLQPSTQATDADAAWGRGVQLFESKDDEPALGAFQESQKLFIAAHEQGAEEVAARRRRDQDLTATARSDFEEVFAKLERYEGASRERFERAQKRFSDFESKGAKGRERNAYDLQLVKEQRRWDIHNKVHEVLTAELYKPVESLDIGRRAAAGLLDRQQHGQARAKYGELLAQAGRIEQRFETINPEIIKLTGDGEEGRLGLYEASQANDLSRAVLLLRLGGDVNARADDGTRPLDVAGSTEMRDLLVNNEAKDKDYWDVADTRYDMNSIAAHWKATAAETKDAPIAATDRARIAALIKKAMASEQAARAAERGGDPERARTEYEDAIGHYATAVGAQGRAIEEENARRESARVRDARRDKAETVRATALDRRRAWASHKNSATGVIAILDGKLSGTDPGGALLDAGDDAFYLGNYDAAAAAYGKAAVVYEEAARKAN